MKFLDNLRVWYAETSGLVDTIYDAKLKEFVDAKHRRRLEKYEKQNKKSE